MPKAVAVPPRVVVAGPAGPMPQLSMERLRPPEWHRAIVEAVATARHVFSGTYQFDHTLLHETFLRRLSSCRLRPFELVVLVDKECYEKGTPSRQGTMLRNLRRAGAEVVLCRGTVATGAMHGKAIVVDRRTAFMGSANLTQKSERNGELLWRMRGPPVMDVLEFLEEERQGGTALQ